MSAWWAGNPGTAHRVGSRRRRSDDDGTRVGSRRWESVAICRRPHVDRRATASSARGHRRSCRSARPATDVRSGTTPASWLDDDARRKEGSRKSCAQDGIPDDEAAEAEAAAAAAAVAAVAVRERPERTPASCRRSDNRRCSAAAADNPPGVHL